MSARRRGRPSAAPAADDDPQRRHPGATPVMAQFLDMKAAHPDSLLFFRMGDFYELFFDDAAQAAEALGIALTHRGTHEDAPIPMCGVPIHHAERYLHRLIRAGFRVAVAEQMEDPAEARKRGSKAVVRREVIRLVTPGTLTEDALLETARHNYLAAYAALRDGTGALAWTDVSTGALSSRVCDAEALPALLARLAPAELIVAGPASAEIAALARETGAALAEAAPASFQPARGAARAAALFGAATLDAFGAFEPAEAGALGALVDYLELTQKGRTPLLQPPRRETADAGMRIDPATRRNLELTESLSGGRAGSLLAAVDRTRTAAGARLLAERLAAPLTDLAEIRARHDAAALLIEHAATRDRIRALLGETPDLARALSRRRARPLLRAQHHRSARQPDRRAKRAGRRRRVLVRAADPRADRPAVDRDRNAARERYANHRTRNRKQRHLNPGDRTQWSARS